ncbi:Cleavage and polyadenylation specificity factor subunit 3 [Camponotus floridanus]|uniref:Cleavage and polyadenylation specificity factor subunit 3 n=2 Tax=Camponotus floridanus TaxID=104421 RepID=E2AIH9_CAMFO|nr:Cleavage and polyadenylation specificity factor subunit 3 [Camponotus floridanus]
MELSGAGMPVGAVACPVCTLYLREGISLQKHLDTHPKEQTPQASPQVSQNSAHISTHSPYPIGPIFECPPINTMMPPQFTSFSYQQFVNNGTMMIPQYTMAPQANQMMQMLYNPYGMYQQQQIPTVQMISPVAAIPGAARIRPVVTMAGESNVRTALAIPVNSPEPKQILPEILPDTEPESGQVMPDVNLPASPVLQNEDVSIRQEESGSNALPIDHRGQQMQSTASSGESTVQHGYNTIPRSITIACAMNNTDDDKVESVLPDMEDEEPSNNISTVDLQCKSITYEPEVQQFAQQVMQEEYVSISSRKTNATNDVDSMACEHESEIMSDERPASRNSSVSISNNVPSPREPITIDALKDSIQPELNSVEKLENLITIMETELNSASQQKENSLSNDRERLDTREKSDREETVIHDTVVTILGSHEKNHILPDIQKDNNTWCPNDYVDNELRTLEKTCRYLSYNTECPKVDENELKTLEKNLHLYKYKHSFSAPPSPVTRKKCHKITHHYSARSELGSCENLISYHHRIGFDEDEDENKNEDDDENEDEEEDEELDEDEKIDEEDNFDEADMEIEEIPSPHTPFAECGVRSHTPLSTISGISVLRVRKDLSKPCSPTSIHSFHHVDSDSISHDEDSNGVDSNIVDNIAEKDPIDCSQIEEKIKTDHQHQEARATVCENVEKVQESSNSNSYAYQQSVITEHVSSFPVMHSQPPVLMHESYSATSKTQNLLNLSESINPTTSTESKSFHSTKSTLMPKQSMELLNINEDAHAGPMNVFEFDGLQILVPSTFISDSSQKAVSATSQQSMASSEGAIGIDEEVKSINMRADETMPPRGELSEQESNGCTEPSAWQFYMGQESSRMSTSYDLLARESWEESEGSDNEISGPLLDSRSLATHFTSSLFLDRDRKTPTKRTFKCSHCNEVFDCPKERRVHSTTVHKEAVPSSSRDQLDQSEMKDIKLLDNRVNVFDDIFVPGLHMQQMYHHQQPLLHQLQPPPSQPGSDGLTKAEADQKIGENLVIPSSIEVTCAICSQRFSSEKSLQIHHRRMHLAEDNSLRKIGIFDKMSAKRKSDTQVPAEESDLLSIRPLGAGQEVGRSCIMLEFKGKKIMLDCGIHPGLSGMDALPFVDLVEADEIDLLLISHFHLDHCGALPWFLQKTSFKGRCFMTHATKAIYRWLLSDYIKVSNIATEQMLYTESDLETSMDKIETINFHEEKDVFGIKFWAYNAGHVLGAAMFMIEIAGVKILYTGDFSRQEDRHLMAAEIPNIHPDVLITESTYGTHIHEKREDREGRFTNLVHEIVNRGGRCLIPVFALGRAQELLLILDEYWSQHSELHEIPIYYASSLAKKCMAVYQTYVNAMNDKIRRQIAINNPFVFKHISNLKGIDHFEDIGPCVVMASPGMMQSGLSRELFESWCTDAKNGVIIAGYCVEGTLAKTILSEPEEITTMSGQKLPLKMSVDYISFSAHTDYQQTSEFIRTLKPPHVVLVHGEQNEMGRLKAALQREYEDDPSTSMEIHNPRNTVAVELYFRGEKTAKVMGTLAMETPKPGQKLSGVLVKRNFNYHMLAPCDLSKYTDMSMSQVIQRQSVYFSASLPVLKHLLTQIAGNLEVVDDKKLRVFKNVDVTIDGKIVTMEWVATPVNDMYADSVLTAILQAEIMDQSPKILPAPTKMDRMHFKECLIEMLQEMFGEDSVPKIFKGEKLYVTVDGKKAHIDLLNLEVTCKEDEVFQQVVQTAVMKLHQSLAPPCDVI